MVHVLEQAWLIILIAPKFLAQIEARFVYYLNCSVQQVDISLQSDVWQYLSCTATKSCEDKVFHSSPSQALWTSSDPVRWDIKKVHVISTNSFHWVTKSFPRIGVNWLWQTLDRQLEKKNVAFTKKFRLLQSFFLWDNLLVILPA